MPASRHHCSSVLWNSVIRNFLTTQYLQPAEIEHHTNLQPVWQNSVVKIFLITAASSSVGRIWPKNFRSFGDGICSCRKIAQKPMISMDKTNCRCEKISVRKNKQALKFFDHRQVRTIWSEQEEKWYFSAVDIIAVLTDSANTANYWRVLKRRLKSEGNETITKCNGFKMLAPDGKMRLTDMLDTEGVLRLIQSIPSKNAAPFKLWLAQVGRERIDEIADPELAIDRALKTYERKGYSKE
jgi:hypothetical protein